MSSSIMGFGGMLITLPILICQWVGIVGLGKTNRNAAWWCMMSGACCTTLGTIFSSVLIGLMIYDHSGRTGPLSSLSYFMISSGIGALGSLLFGIGFAMHGQQASKMQQRIAELESIANAQGEQLSRQPAF